MELSRVFRVGRCWITSGLGLLLAVSVALARDIDRLPFAQPMRSIIPVYPYAAAKACEQADVQLEMRLNRYGDASSVDVVSCTLKNRGFEKAAEDAVEHTTFIPLSYLSSQQSGRARFEIHFRCYHGYIMSSRYAIARDTGIRSDTLAGSGKGSVPPKMPYKRTLTLYRAATGGSSSDTLENDVFVLYNYNKAGEPVNLRVICASVPDSQFSADAIQAVVDFERQREFHWHGYPDSTMVRVAFRSHEPEETKPERDSSEHQPVMVKQAVPDYPMSAKREDKTGTVAVRALVGKDGAVHEADVWRSCGYPELDSAAVASAYKCEFTAGEQRGKKMSVWVLWKIDFKIN